MLQQFSGICWWIMGERGRGIFCSYTGQKLGYDNQTLLLPFLLACSAVLGKSFLKVLPWRLKMHLINHFPALFIQIAASNGRNICNMDLLKKKCASSVSVENFSIQKERVTQQCQELTCPVRRGWFLLQLQVQTLTCGRRNSGVVHIPLAGFRAHERNTDGKHPAMATKWDLGGDIGVTTGAKLHWLIQKMDVFRAAHLQFLLQLYFGSYASLDTY